MRRGFRGGASLTQRDAVGRASGGPRDHLDEPYPGGESWRQAVDRVGRFLADLPLRWDGQRVVVIGHVATRWGLDHHLNGVALETLVAEEFAWHRAEYRLSHSHATQGSPQSQPPCPSSSSQRSGLDTDDAERSRGCGAGGASGEPGVPALAPPVRGPVTLVAEERSGCIVARVSWP